MLESQFDAVQYPALVKEWQRPKCTSLPIKEPGHPAQSPRQAPWTLSSVVDIWRDELIVPVPKKNNLPSCYNWHGIRKSQNHPQAIATGLLPDGCTDMIFAAR